MVARDAPTQPTTSTPRVELDLPRRRRTAPIAVAVLGIGALGAVAIWQLGGSKRTAENPIVAVADAASDTATEVDAVPVSLDAAAIDAALVEPIVDARSPADGRVAQRDARIADATVAIAPPPDATTGTGYLQVLGEDLIGASVIVDGRTLGSVPNVFAVSQGRHTIEVERKDGSRLRSLSVEVTPVHNRANPLRPTW